MLHIFHILTAFATIIPSVFGGYAIINSCTAPITVTKQAGMATNAPATTTLVIGDTFSAEYEPLAPVDGKKPGWSIKLNSYLGITQFEYNIDEDAVQLWFDISYVDGYATEDWTLAGTNDCHPAQMAYFCPHDDLATQKCVKSDNLTLTLCEGSKPISGGGCGIETVVVATGAAESTIGSTSSQLSMGERSEPTSAEAASPVAEPTPAVEQPASYQYSGNRGHHRRNAHLANHKRSINFFS